MRLERRLKTGRVRIQDLDKFAPRHCYSTRRMSVYPCRDGSYPSLENTMERSASNTSRATSRGVLPEAMIGPPLGNDEKRPWHEELLSCVICQDLLDGHVHVRELRCGHVFHAECIEKWLTKCRVFCPVCKSQVQDISRGDLHSTV